VSILTRRRFVLLSTVALLGAACAPTEPVAAGLRGSGTVLRPRELEAVVLHPDPTAEPTLMPLAGPTPAVRPSPMAEPDREPIVPAEAVPSPVIGETYAQAHVLPVPPRQSTVQPLPARRVVIPTIGVDSKVIQLGTKIDRRGQIAWETAPFAVGQHKGLAGPGQNGNMVLSGHISSPGEGAIFHHLPEVKPGEGVIVSTDERQYLYRVLDVKTVTPDQVSVMDQTPDATLTLITCVPDGIYSHRLVVTARLV
jgi:LPXTG-site transpeptidase (sortase) family protein